MDELAGVNALYTEAKDALDQIKADEQELSELREMKADVERKEKQQAEIIHSQVRWLAALEAGGRARAAHALGRGADLHWGQGLLLCLCALPQSKRLEELEKLFRDEQVARKRAVNAMEDMKVRPKCPHAPTVARGDGGVDEQVWRAEWRSWRLHE